MARTIAPREKLNIIDFCRDPNLLNLNLLDTQEVILRVIYRLGLNPEQKTILRRMRGGGKVSEILKYEYQEVVLILGRRSGKTTLTAAIAAYESCMTDWTTFIRPGEFAWIFVFATRETQAIDVGRNMIFANIRKSPILRELIVEDPREMRSVEMPRSKAGVMVLRTGAAITALPCSSRVGRGYACPVAIFDEMAFYARESEAKNTDQEIYDSVIPNQLQFGPSAKRVIITTPADKDGLVYRKWVERKKYQDLYYIQRTPTWNIRTDFPKEEFKRIQRLSPIGFRREMGAQFISSLSPLLVEADVAKALRDDETPLPFKDDGDTLYVIAIDAAFGDRDRFGLAVGHLETIDDENFRIVIDLAETIEGDFETDVHDAAIERIRQVYEIYDGYEVFADQYEFNAFSKSLEDRGINVTELPWTAQRHRDCYGKLRACLKRGIVSLPNNPDLVEELLGLKVKFMPSGQFTIDHAKPGHDDIADCVGIIVDQLYEEDTSAIGVEWV